jgi:HD-GYP domain-containing protein (c-di-GMP phosphodiesterase class II)
MNGLPPQGDPFADEITVPGAAAYDAQAQSVLGAKYSQCIDQMERIQEELLFHQGFDATSLARITDEALEELKADRDLFVSLGINLTDDSYPAKHSTCTGMLSMAMGAQLGLDRPTLKELAIGCLIHDAGMLKIQQKLYQTQDRLDRVSFLEVMKHPILIYDIIANNRRIPQHAAAIAYQTHERCDGSGYPRRRTSSQIDFLAKIAAVADVFIALVSPRPHRQALLPYQAMEKILRGVRQGLYD